MAGAVGEEVVEDYAEDWEKEDYKKPEDLV